MPARVGRLAGLAALAALLGCGSSAPESALGPAPATRTASAAAAATTPVVREPALCAARLRVRVTGRVTSPAARELSGLVMSRSRPGVLWTHNDSGDSARLLAVTTSGRTVAEVALTGAQNIDWEDIATGPGGALLVGDTGDNDGERASVVVYRVPEPQGTVATRSSVAVAERYELRYPDGARDAEALLFDRASGAIVIVTKSFGGNARVYVARRPSSRRVTTLRRSGTLALGAGEAVTAGDVSGDGRTIALRTYDRAFVWRRRPGETVAATLRRPHCSADADLLREGQGEALALTGDGRAFFTVPEGRRATLRRYESGSQVSKR
ncbi:MAG: hypothetical protein QOH83_1966 [Solirubrobacteraceae bacterium]|nr:hypothetical protein [Solirubrobacteraceae bacterium]